MTTYFTGSYSVNKSINDEELENMVLGIESDGEVVKLYELGNDEEPIVTEVPIDNINSAMNLFNTYIVDSEEQDEELMDEINDDFFNGNHLDFRDRLMFDFDINSDDIHTSFNNFSRDPLTFTNSTNTTGPDFFRDLFNYHQFTRPKNEEVNFIVAKEYNPKHKKTNKRVKSDKKLKLKKNKTAKAKRGKKGAKKSN